MEKDEKLGGTCLLNFNFYGCIVSLSKCFSFVNVGYIAMGFFLVGGVASLFFGYLADTMNRCQLFCIVVMCGEVACFATSLVTHYWQLLLCRILTGISIGGVTPIIFSLVGDLFAEDVRVYVCTLGIS